jgi:MscS family membrane protein
VLAQAGIENFATREKMLVQNTLRLRHGTSVEQLRRILDGIRGVLDAERKIESETARIRLVNFGAESIELELFAYVLTANAPEFQAVREDLLLKIATIIEAASSSFAPPTQFIYMDKRDFDALPGAHATRESEFISGARTATMRGGPT